jgi:hypothetical protein
MARVFGEPGRNAAEKSHKETRRVLLTAFVGMGLFAVIWGYTLNGLFPMPKLSLVGAVLAFAIVVALMSVISNWSLKKIDAIDRNRLAWRKCAVGEHLVAEVLRGLPNDFIVVNDVTKRLANIDHIVIGPTGVYVIDTKNWKGTVAANGSGELLVNGKATQKPSVKTTLRATMDFQSKLKALAEKDYFVRGLMVFPLAYVEANFGSTGHIHCLRDERLVDYIQNQTFSTKLDADDIARIKRATLQLAQMDQQFVGKT